MKLGTFLLLLEGKAWFPSIKSLSEMDPLEGALGDGYDTFLFQELERVGSYEETRNWLLGKIPQATLTALQNGDGNPIYEDYAIAREYRRQMMSRRVAWCWFAHDIESAAMWRIYGHLGVAVKTDWKSLRDSLPRRVRVNISSMEYIDHRLSRPKSLKAAFDRDPDLILHPHRMKAIEYEHEREVRVHAFCPEGMKGRLVTGINWENLVKEVRISPLLPFSESMVIEKMIKSSFKDFEQIQMSRLSGVSHTEWFQQDSMECRYGNDDEQIKIDSTPGVFRDL